MISNYGYFYQFLTGPTGPLTLAVATLDKFEEKNEQYKSIKDKLETELFNIENTYDLRLEQIIGIHPSEIAGYEDEGLSVEDQLVLALDNVEAGGALAIADISIERAGKQIDKHSQTLDLLNEKLEIEVAI